MPSVMRLILILCFVMAALVACNSKKNPAPASVPADEYTQEVPGPWEGMEDSHAPKFDYRREQSQNNLLAYVILKNPEPNHYIEVMGIMDESRKDVVPAIHFGRGHTTVQNFFTVDSFRYAREKKWKVYVKCSLHDLWTREILDK
jgi:desulfoferrodoxin (superoxide reductase-like protein)